MNRPVLVLGFDACEIALVERWIGEGALPRLAALRARSATFELASPMETLPGAIWPEINTGVSAGTMGDFYVPNQLRTGEARLRATRPDELDTSKYYWAVASAAGRRVAVIDPVQAVPVRGLDGVQLIEWGLHDRTFDVSSDPPSLLASIRARHGDHPVRSCDTHGETEAGYRTLLDGLVRGARAKGSFVPEMLRAARYDLVACTFSESHCVGHQFWHFLDARHPWHRTDAPADLARAIRTVYEAIDEACGRVIDAMPDARVLAVFSHGMDLYYDGPQLLPEVLVRLGLASGGRSAGYAWLRELKRRITYLPRPVKAVIKRAVRSDLLHGAVAASGALVDPFASPRTRAAFVNNNRCGGIRLNLRGREPHGSVEPGEEAASLIAFIRRELEALRDPASGRPIVARTLTAQEAYGPSHHRDLPDLIVVFRTDVGMIERCESPAVGHVHVPVYHPHAPRSGDHTPHSRLWASGPAIERTPVVGAGNVRDVAPTALSLLGVPIPAWIEGSPLPFARTAARAAAMAS